MKNGPSFLGIVAGAFCFCYLVFNVRQCNRDSEEQLTKRQAIVVSTTNAPTLNKAPFGPFPTPVKR
jgi:hypothetical protein